MNAIKCHCTCIYPDDMEKCPTCGRPTISNKVDGKVLHKIQKQNVTSNKPRNVANPNVVQMLLKQAEDNPDKATTCFKCGVKYPNTLKACPKCGSGNSGGYVASTKNNAVHVPPKNHNLVDCMACGHQISTRAESCPHCGNPTGIHVCPKCNSTNTRVITGTSKAASIFLWGAFAANKVVSKYECKDCGHKF